MEAGVTSPLGEIMLNDEVFLRTVPEEQILAKYIRWDSVYVYLNTDS